MNPKLLLLLAAVYFVMREPDLGGSEVIDWWFKPGPNTLQYHPGHTPPDQGYRPASEWEKLYYGGLASSDVIGAPSVWTVG